MTASHAPDPAVATGWPKAVLPKGLQFAAIGGGTIALDALAGRAVLVVNTASLCGLTPQLAALQALDTQFRDRGLVVLAVPSGDFDQELADDDAVKAFCDVTFGLTIPMTTITPVLGAKAHPLYRWLADSAGFVPEWNFAKALIGRDGTVAGTWDAALPPDSAPILAAIDAALAR